MGRDEEETLNREGGRRRRRSRKKGRKEKKRGGNLEGRYFACVKESTKQATRKEEIPSLYAAYPVLD
uniref:Uncharacterized protein n=1 Tax=Cucumis melo TaxID=3656 RepID=A0A9I9DNU7_CUCME